MLHSEKGTPCGRCQLLSFQRLEQLGDQGKTAFEPLIIHQKPSWIHFWIHCVRDVSPSLKFQRFQNCEFVRLPPSAPIETPSNRRTFSVGINPEGGEPPTAEWLRSKPPPVTAPSKGMLRCLLWYTIRYEWRKKRQ